jgi:hypothetical protein
VSTTQKSPYPAEITGGGVVLALTPDELYFETVQALPAEELAALIARHNLEPVAEPGSLFGGSVNRAFPDRRWVRILDGAQPRAVAAALEADDRVRLASPVYNRPDLPFKTALSFSDLVLVKYRGAGRPITDIAGAAGTDGLEIAAEIEQPDGDLLRLRLPAPKQSDALDIAGQLSGLAGVTEVHPDWMQLISALAITPDDPLFSQEWDMTQIDAPQGWSLSEGSASVVIAIVDTGCDLGHEDLSGKYVPVAQRRDVVAGTSTPNDDFGHGTCCASIAAAATSNGLGAAGVGWGCEIMPIRMLQNAIINSEADIVAAINWAAGNGANVVSMSWYWTGTTSNADTAFAAAATAGLVLCAASGNFDSPTITYPATNPNIMAIGASDKIDQRKSPASPDGECWGSDYGPQQSVIAPGVQCWAANNTDGGASFNDNDGGPITWACVSYPSSGTSDEKYFALMNGTSAATPHVAGLAGLLLSAYPGLTRTQVRNIIEQTADKTGGYAYANDGVHNNGSWNAEPGYGRINVFRALDYADVFIRAFPSDTGSRPVSGVFWASSDIVIRQQDDGIFANQPAVAGQDNYVYVRINNAGPNAARNVTVSARAVAFLGTQFSYPGDFTAVDATHLLPAGLLTSFSGLPAGTTAIAKFRLTAAQVGMIYTDAWHSCLIASVSADNDYGSGEGPNVWENNNLGQLNFSVVASGGAMSAGGALSLPFVTGNAHDPDRYYELVIDRSALPADAELVLDPSPAAGLFPALGPAGSDGGSAGCKPFVTTFLDRTRITARFCECDGVLTLASGSTFTCAEDLADQLAISGGSVGWQDGVQVVRVEAAVAVIGIPRASGEIRVMEASLTLAHGTPAGAYRVVVSQRNISGQTVGGVTYQVTVS